MGLALGIQTKLGDRFGPALRPLLEEVAYADPAPSNRQVAEGYLARG